MVDQQKELVGKLLGAGTVLYFCPPCTGSRPQGVGLWGCCCWQCLTSNHRHMGFLWFGFFN